MKAIRPFLFYALTLCAGACTSGFKFPVSTVVPAAEISGTIKPDNHKNYVIRLTAEHMASAHRLSPSKKNYVVWIVTGDRDTKNAGKLDVANGKKTSFTTSTPFEVKEIFITAEDGSDMVYPSGVEIARKRF